MELRTTHFFIDSNVFIQALLYPRSASADLFRVNSWLFTAFTSDISMQEANHAARRKELPLTELEDLFAFCSVIKLLGQGAHINEYLPYVSDRDDAHIVAGAVQAGADIITFNTRHFNAPQILEDLKYKVVKPGEFLSSSRTPTKQ